MSKIHRNTALASALLATLMLAAPAAFAVTLDNGSLANPLPMKVANVAFNGGTAPGVALNALNVNISSSDLIIGRTTGFSVRIDLPSNVTFASLPTPAIGSALPCSGGLSCWTVTLAAGGTSSDSYAVFSVQPGANSQGVTTGTALSFASGGITGGSYPNYTFSGLAITGQGVGNLLTIGSSVAAKVTFADPNTAQQILTPVTQTLVVSASPLAYSVAPSSNPLKKIDVGSAVVASKTGYSSDGTLNKNPSQSFFDAGTPTIAVAAGVEDLNNVPFGWQNADTLNLTVTGTFTAFMQAGAQVELVFPFFGGCSASPFGTIATGTVTASQITFSGVSLGSMPGYAAILCFVVPGSNAQVIDATTVSTAATVTRSSSGKSDNGTGNGLAMAYNGPVAVVYTFNPAGNTSQQSFLRISNTGAASGLVTITAKDDSGAAAAGSISMTLSAGKSIQLNSTDLENGNTAKGLTGSLGVGSGKWILTVTGEISGMEVTNLNRNNTSGTVSNLGTPVTGDH